MIRAFYGEHFYLSNFYPCLVEYEGLTYLSSEAAFQAAKCKNVEDRVLFTNLKPNDSKKLGRKIELRDDWELVKDPQVMFSVLKCKFDQNDGIRKKFIYTGNQFLEEGNTWGDTYWGTCNGSGKNRLGYNLMDLRSLYHKELSLSFPDLG